MSNTLDAGTIAHNLERVTPYADHKEFTALGHRLAVAVESARYEIQDPTGSAWAIGQSVLQAAADLGTMTDEMSLEYRVGLVVSAIFPNLVEMDDALEIARARQAREAAGA